MGVDLGSYLCSEVLLPMENGVSCQQSSVIFANDAFATNLKGLSFGRQASSK